MSSSEAFAVSLPGKNMETSGLALPSGPRMKIIGDRGNCRQDCD